MNTELNNSVAMAHPKLIRGMVWCTTCGRSQHVSAGKCFVNGWPKCCGYTMTLDSPDERKALGESHDH
jgi:hypothetical protein